MGQVVSLIWSFLDGWSIPWLGVSPATLLVTLIVISLSLNILRLLLGLGRGGLSHIRSDRGSRSSNSSRGG